jgi:prephenate dehydrogenase
MPPQILIVGLGPMGSAIGLALSQTDDPPTRFGYDRNKHVASAALEAGVYERRVLDPRKTASEVDLVVLALPPGEAAGLIQDLANVLKPGATLLDLTRGAHDPEVAASIAGLGGRIIRGSLVVSAEQMGAPEDEPEGGADLYQGGLLGLAIGPDTPEASIELALSLAEAMRVSPFFIDAAELEYVDAAVDLFPAILGLLVLRSLSATPGWGNVQRLAGRPFASYVSHATTQGEELTAQIWARRTSLLAQLDSLAEEVVTIRAALQGDTSEQLDALVDQALEAHDDWMRVRLQRRPKSDSDKAPPKTGILGNLFGPGPRHPPDPDSA